jgi:hypothetical protein
MDYSSSATAYERRQCTGLRPSAGGLYFRCRGVQASDTGRCVACLSFCQPQSAVEGGRVHRCGHPKKTGGGGPCQSAVEVPGTLCVHHGHEVMATRREASSKSQPQKRITHFFKPVCG